MGEDRRSRTSRSTITQMVVIGLIASAIGIAAGLAIDWFPVQASKQAKKIDTFWDVLIICSVPMFVLVATVVLFAVKEFRMRPGEENLDGPPIHGNTRLEVIWTAFPAIMLVSLCTYAYIVLHDVEKAPAATGKPEMVVDVYGQQFTWTFQYKAQGKKITTAQLYLPINRSVKFNVHTKDVLHDFWVPAFRMKIDAVPGITTHYRVTPDRLGNYAVVCAELCGLGHAFMRQTAHVMTEAKFDDWMSKQVNPPAAAGGGAAGAGAAPDGKTLFMQGNQNGATPCASCHQLADAGSPQGIGPDLDKALATEPPAFIRESIVNPNKEIAKGYPANVMPPNFAQTLSPQELDALVKYLVKVTHK